MSEMGWEGSRFLFSKSVFMVRRLELELLPGVIVLLASALGVVDGSGIAAGTSLGATLVDILPEKMLVALFDRVVEWTGRGIDELTESGVEVLAGRGVEVLA